MDLNLLFGIAGTLLIVTVITWLFTRRSSSSSVATDSTQARPSRAVHPDAAANADIPRRAQIARNQRHRPQATAAAAHQDSDSDEENQDNNTRNVLVGDEKMGAKKRAKLEAKAEKKQQREAELQAREEKKKRDAIAEEERRKFEQAEEDAERKKDEAERDAREKQERKEHEEYLKLKAAFEVQEEGFDECDEDEKENLLQTFVNHIKENKVIVLEDLATQFKLKTQAVIDRITDLQETGTLTGVIDDQGKFIYISDNELNEISNFIRQRGRVSITELAESSNNLVNLKPNADVMITS